jgi:hypothetical protein
MTEETKIDENEFIITPVEGNEIDFNFLSDFFTIHFNENLVKNKKFLEVLKILMDLEVENWDDFTNKLGAFLKINNYI